MYCVLTYDHPHRKTEDLLLLLKKRGYEVAAVGTPWIAKKSLRPLFKHKPDTQRHIKDVSNDLGYSYDVGHNLSAYFNNMKPELILIGAAGVLPKDIVTNFTFINSHPGYLPYCRGLDALKWSLYEDIQIGVTTHIIDQNVDMGRLIRREKTPIRADDTFDSIAARHYNLEVTLLADALEDIRTAPLTKLPDTESRVHKRMPNEVELKMKEKVDKMSRNYCGEYNKA